MKLSDFNIVYINIDDRQDRRKSIEKQLKSNGLNATRISAVYGIKLREKKYREKISYAKGGIPVPEQKLRPKFWMNRSNFKSMISDETLILGRVGCFLSHLKCYKYALDKGWDNILILEDDVRLLPNCSNEEFELPDNGQADIYYFGGMFWHAGPNGFDKKAHDGKPSNNQWIKINPEKLKLICCHSYAFANKKSIKDMYNLCMSVFLDSDKGFDKHDEWRSGKVKMRAQAIDFACINHFQKNGKCYVHNPVFFIQNENFGSNISPHYGTSSKKWKHSYFYTENRNKSNTYIKSNNRKSNTYRRKSNNRKSNTYRRKSNRKSNTYRRKSNRKSKTYRRNSNMYRRNSNTYRRIKFKHV
jgi:hypothetical protein